MEMKVVHLKSHEGSDLLALHIRVKEEKGVMLCIMQKEHLIPMCRGSLRRESEDHAAEGSTCYVGLC